MITYIVKTLLCTAVLFLIYFLLLEREKMHRFNRFYLLFSIVFSLTVSLITIKTPSPVIAVNELITPSGISNIVATINGLDKLNHPDNSTKSTAKASTTTNLLKTPIPVPIEKSIPWFTIFLGLYIAGTAFLLIKFIRNLYLLLIKAAHNKKVSYHEATLVLTKDNALPHSFLNYIFIDKQKFEHGTIEKEILKHELTHVNQKHSIDILLVELIMIFAWINPLLFLFRKAIMLNHEYLADDAVLHTFNNTESYRLLLFNTVSQNNNLVLSSPFNYLITKKRLIMMTRNTSRKVAILKQIALIPLIAAIGFLLSTRASAQDKPKQERERIGYMVGPPYEVKNEVGKPDAPQRVVNEYKSIASAYKFDTIALANFHFSFRATPEENKEFWKLAHEDTFQLKKPDRERLINLFFQMSKKQQSRQFLQFRKIETLKTKIVPTKAQMKLWQDTKVYGIWINGKRVKNSVLNTLPTTDFSYYELIKYDNEKAKIMKYQIEVGLLTNENFVRVQKYTLDRLNAYPRDNYQLVMHVTTKAKDLSIKTTNK
jgi:beta-lactamase regulating signal transducer with metallopeptidase domain